MSSAFPRHLRTIREPRWRLRPLEVVWTVPFGIADGVEPLPRHHNGIRQAFEDVVRPALLRPPCVVSFSGGRDSATVLAVATDLARREGLDLPVPMTHRFPRLPESDETAEQEAVIRRLGLPDWERPEWTEEFDVTGTFARRVLDRHGVLPPFNLHFHEPIAERAAGGSLLTGVGGDELFAPVRRSVPARVLAGRRRVSVREVPGVLASVLAPTPLRVRHIEKKLPLGFSWLTRQGRRSLGAALAADAAAEPLSWARAVRTTTWPGRRLQLHREALAVLGAAHDVVVESPFCAAEVLAAAAGDLGAAGPRARGVQLDELAGDVLPAEIVARTSKATFDGAFWTGAGRDVALHWDGTLPPEFDGLVDPSALQQEWLSDHPDAHSFSLLQTVLRPTTAAQPPDESSPATP